MLALTGDTRRWEPKRLRLRLFSAAAQLIHIGRRRWLHFTARWPWTDIINPPQLREDRTLRTQSPRQQTHGDS